MRADSSASSICLGSNSSMMPIGELLMRRQIIPASGLEGLDRLLAPLELTPQHGLLGALVQLLARLLSPLSAVR